MSPLGDRRHFPVQQRHSGASASTLPVEDRSAVIFLSAFATIASFIYALTAPLLGAVPLIGWVGVGIIFIASSSAWVVAIRGGVRVALILTLSGLWLSAALLLVVAGRFAPSAELFTVTVVLASLALGARPAIFLIVVSAAMLILMGWLLPYGVDPEAAAVIGRRRPVAEAELFVFGSLVILWWSRRSERFQREHEGSAQIRRTLRQAVASSRAGIAVADTEGRLTYINTALAEMWRLGDPTDAIGRTVFDFWADPSAASVALMGFAEGTQPVAKLRGLRADRTEFDVEVSGSRVLDDDGTVTGYIGSFVDVNERTLAEEQLLVERERTRAIVDSVLDIVVILDASGTIVFENSAVERVLGFAPGERIGQSIMSHAHPDDIARAGAGFAGVMQGRDTVVRVTLRFRHKDGSWRWLETFGRNLMHVPAIGGILGVGRDVTEQRDMQARLEASDRLETVGRLAGGIAHDFNNLLTAILGNAELARAIPDVAEVASPYLDGVIQAGERARDLTRKLLAFARREIAQPVVVDVAQRLEQTGDLVRRLLGATIDCRIEMSDGPLKVLMDPVQLEQIVLNLAVNARDAMTRGGTFTVRASLVTLDVIDPSFLGHATPGRLIKIEVSDSGQGMPPEVAARVFEPFFTTKEQGRGTGLGLSTVYGGVVQAGGSIRVISAPGAGTTFEILLPMASGDVEPMPATAAGDRAAATPATTVLVAEDDEGVRMFMVEVLRKAGCAVLEARDGVEGSTVAESHGGPIELLVTDVIMPNRNGIELAKHFLHLRPGARVMFVTGFSSDPTIEDQADAMGAQVLLKPFTVDQLLAGVRRALE